MTRLGMVIDLKRCIGCDACSMACKSSNATSRGILWSRVLKYETGKYPDSQLNFLPVTCMHCEEPECVKACPTGATTIGEDGIVSIDESKCVGCRYCMMACPYAVRYFYEDLKPYYEGFVTPYEKVKEYKHKLGTVEKCDFCQERVKDGLEPACVVACPVVARFFGDLDDPDSEVSQLIKERKNFVLNPELGTKPKVFYLTRDGEVNSENG